MIQIADIFRILYEYEYLTQNDIVQTFKQIATNLYLGFSTLILAEQEIVKAMCFWKKNRSWKQRKSSLRI